MDDLLRLAKPIAINEIGTLKPCGRYCAITFDDGFICIRDNALPELSKRNIPATMFVPSGCLGQQPPWLDEENFDHRNVVMTAAQLNCLDKNFILIGSHGRTHQNLLQISQDEARKEIIQSKKELEKIMNTPIETISFPHGDFDQTHIDMAVQAGYKNAYSILPELISSDSDNFLRGRVKVDPTDWRIEYRLKLLGAYRWLPIAFALKRIFRAFSINRTKGNHDR
jgi:peptidoglycan/xylan/chitin deacetylase (PgdA/CDA1 family)